MERGQLRYLTLTPGPPAAYQTWWMSEHSTHRTAHWHAEESHVQTQEMMITRPALCGSQEPGHCPTPWSTPGQDMCHLPPVREHFSWEERVLETTKRQNYWNMMVRLSLDLSSNIAPSRLITTIFANYLSIKVCLRNKWSSRGVALCGWRRVHHEDSLSLHGPGLAAGYLKSQWRKDRSCLLQLHVWRKQGKTQCPGLFCRLIIF